MKKLLYIPAILVLAACNNKPKDKAAELASLKKQEATINGKITTLEAELGSKDSLKSTDVSTVIVKPGNFTNYVDLQGHIDAQEDVTAYSQMAGAITNIYVKPGQQVSKGQVLVQLDNSVLVQQIAQAQTQLNLNKILFERQKNLWDQKIGTEVQFLTAQQALQSSTKQIALLHQQAAQFRITSPINGTIDQMDLKLGQVIQPGKDGIRIVNASILKVKADVPESYSSSIHQDDNVEVIFPDLSDSLMAKVTFAAKVIDPGSRSFAIEIKLPSNREFRPNMTALIKVADYSKKNSIVIPLNSIQRSDTSTFVFIDENGFAKRKDVKVGATYGGKSEILSGLQPGDQLVTEGASDVEDGDKIRVLNSGN